MNVGTFDIVRKSYLYDFRKYSHLVEVVDIVRKSNWYDFRKVSDTVGTGVIIHIHLYYNQDSPTLCWLGHEWSTF
jgi:hypothetical protein